MNWNVCGGKRSWYNLRYYPGIILEILRKPQKICHNSRSPARHLKPRPPKYEAEVIAVRAQYLGHKQVKKQSCSAIAMQAQGGEEIKLHIPDLGLRWGEWSASRPGRALPPRKDSWYPLDRRILQKRRPQLRTTVLGLNLYDLFCSCNSCKTNDPLFKDYFFTVMFNDTPMISFGAVNTDKKMLTLLELSSRNTVGTLLVSYSLQNWNCGCLCSL
jgi:hypothetical protein